MSASSNEKCGSKNTIPASDFQGLKQSLKITKQGTVVTKFGSDKMQFCVLFLPSPVSNAVETREPAEILSESCLMLKSIPF